MLCLRKDDFIFVKENKENTLWHRIYKTNFGDLPKNSYIDTVKDWLLLADLESKYEYLYDAIDIYTMLLEEFELSEELRKKLIKKLETVKKKANYGYLF